MMMKTQIVIKMVAPPPIFYESGCPSFFCTSLHHRGIFGSFPKRKKHKNEKVHKNSIFKNKVSPNKKKYNSKNLLLTGNKTIKIIKVLDQVSKILKIKKKFTFGNLTDKGHYDVSPYSYVPKKDDKIRIKSTLTLKEGILELIKEIKNEKRN